MATKSCKIGNTVINNLLKVNKLYAHSDFYNRIFIMDGECYIVNGISITKFPASALDFGNSNIPFLDNSNIQYVYFDDLTEIDKKSFESMVENFRSMLYRVNAEGEWLDYKVNKAVMKASLTMAKKKWKEREDVGMAGKSAPFALRFGELKERSKTVVNAKYFVDLLSLHKDKIVKCFVENNPLKPVVVGNGEDGILSVLLPLRDAYIGKEISITEVWEV